MHDFRVHEDIKSTLALPKLEQRGWHVRIADYRHQPSVHSDFQSIHFIRVARYSEVSRIRMLFCKELLPKDSLKFLSLQREHELAECCLNPRQLSAREFVRLCEHDLLERVAEHAWMKDVDARRFDVFDRWLAC